MLETYTNFMTKYHDEIMDQNGQVKTYRKIEVSLWNTDESMDSTNFKHFEFSKLIGIDKYKTIRSEKAHALFMTQIIMKNQKKY
jgi:hypothetical protein